MDMDLISLHLQEWIMNETSFTDRLNSIEEIISKPDFLKNKGLGNEVGYYIFDYPPTEELRVRERVENLKKRMTNIVEFDLYELSMSLLEGKNYLQKTFDLEEQKGTEEVCRGVSKFLRLTNQDNNLIINHIVENTPDNTIVFITGVGKVFPFIRSHTILNNLHQKLYKVPVVMFFPGEYTGQKLRLFNTITDDNYYRAFKLCD